MSASFSWVLLPTRTAIQIALVLVAVGVIAGLAWAWRHADLDDPYDDTDEPFLPDPLNRKGA